MRIVVIGGTGLIGSKLLPTLIDRGHDVVAGALETGLNTLTGEGLAELLEDADVVVDVSNSPSLEGQLAMDFFTTSRRNLLAYGMDAGVTHHVALSVVGTERLQESGYFQAKMAQEELIKESSIPYSILHATQFFEFFRAIANAATTGDEVRLPHVLVQPMAADEVVSALGRIATESPLNDTVEVAGPEMFHLDEFIRTALDAAGDPRRVVADPQARYFDALLSERTLLPEAPARLGELRFESWLGKNVGSKKAA